MKNNYNYLHPIMAVVFLFVAKTLLAYPQTYSISELFLWIGIIAALKSVWDYGKYILTGTYKWLEKFKEFGDKKKNCLD